MPAPRTLTNRTERPRSSAERPVVAHLVRVLDYEQPMAPGARHALVGIDEVVLGRGEAHAAKRAGRTLTISVADPRMSGRHAKLALQLGKWVIEDLGSRNGTIVEGAPQERAVLEDGALVELGRTAFVFRMLPAAATDDVTADTLVAALPGLPTFSTGFATALAGLARIAATKQSIVLHGETGTGKEVVARGVHGASGRSGPFIAVNCGALPETLVESELFGAKKGAFSGATEDRPGLIRGAHGGTLFLDEIGDLPLATQAALLRVLQEHEVTPLGATRPIAVDVRVVAASHRDLEQEVVAGRFREDLVARLAGFVLELPSLRERREDLGILIAALLARLQAPAAIRFAQDAARALLRHEWPRNVRELEQVLGSATALAADGVIQLDHLPPVFRRPPGVAPALADDLTPADLRRRDELRQLLATHRGNIAAVARAMGVARMQIHRWLERYEVDVGAYRNDGTDP